MAKGNKMTLTIVQENVSYSYDVSDKLLTCDHNDVSIVKACCSPFLPRIECGCGGSDSYVCNNIDCTGLSDNDVDRLAGNAFDCD
jgi:hypothetical protein